MNTRRLGGRELAAQVQAEVTARLRVHVARGGRAPRLAAFAVAPGGGVRSYLETQARTAATVGIDFRLETLPEGTDTDTAAARLAALCADPQVDGVVLSWPLPHGLDGERVVAALDPDKDVDALSATRLGHLALDARARAPATARAVMAVLGQAGVDLTRSRVALIGTGRTAGLPTLLLMLHAGAAVDVVHRPTHDVAAAVRRADVVVAAAGSPGLVRAEDVKAGAVIIGVGTTEVDGRLVGDVEEGVDGVASAWAPVPGGVGPVTIAYLMRNALEVVGA